MEYGIRIKKIRELRGYKQLYVASKLGISQQAYSSYENNACDKKLFHLVALSTILHVDVCLIVCTDIPINSSTINLSFKELIQRSNLMVA
jgi:transcriptional regulator with XRE-family HTH domain